MTATSSVDVGVDGFGPGSGRDSRPGSRRDSAVAPAGAVMGAALVGEPGEDNAAGGRV